MSNPRAGGNNQNLIFFNRGKAISGEFKYKGTNQLPNPPINTGITKKNIIIRPWAVIILLYSWLSPMKPPGVPNSNRIKKESLVPKNPPHIPKIK